MRRLGFVAAFALLSSAFAQDAAAPLKFGWPVPSSVVVTEIVERAGMNAITRYRASLTREGPAGELRLHLSDFAFVEFAGKKPDDPAVAAQVTRAQRVAQFTPDLILAADGTIKDVVGLEAVNKVRLDDIEENGTPAQKAAVPMLRKQFQTPEALRDFKREAMKYWRAWVADWIGWTVPEGGRADGRFVVRDIDGTEREAPATYTRTAAADGTGQNLVRTATLDGAATKASLDLYVKTRSAQSGEAPPEGFFTGLKLWSYLIADTDPATLRPVRVIRWDQCLIHRKDRDDFVAANERHEYHFDWTASQDGR
jgi:hypothetical protein